MYQLAVGAMFKWEPRMVEWLEYHRMIGVEHFYLYDNEEPAPIAAYTDLWDYINRGVVTRMPWPGFCPQFTAYNDMVIRSRGEARWVAAIDLDEYLQPLHDFTMLEVLEQYDQPELAGVAFHWCTFGNAGVEKRPDVCFDAFTRRGRPDAWCNGLVKTVFRPERTRRGVSPHHFWADPYCRFVTEDWRTVEKPAVPPAVWQKARVAHYHCKSVEEWEEKKRRGDGWSGNKRGNTWAAHNLNDIEDTSMVKYAEPMRERLAKRARGEWVD